MRLPLRFALALSLAFYAPQSQAGERYLGVIAATTASKTNLSTAVPFTLGGGTLLTIQCTAAAYIATNAASVTTSNGLLIPADTAFPTSMGNATPTTIAIILASGTANCRVYSRQGNES
jgi:hypothetical protein